MALGNVFPVTTSTAQQIFPDHTNEKSTRGRGCGG